MSITGIYVECNRQAAAPSDCGEFVLTGQPAWVEHLGGDGTTQNAVPTLAGRVPYQPEVKFTLRITAFVSAYVLVGPEVYTPGLGNGVWMRAGDVLTYSAQPGDRVSWAATGEVLPPVFTIGAQGLYSGRSAYDSEAPGFVYLSTNGDAGATTTLAMLFFRVGAVSGTWSDGVVFQGPAGAAGPAGPQGPAGAAGADGVSAVYSDATPQLLGGVAAAGIAAAASRADHVHQDPRAILPEILGVVGTAPVLDYAAAVSAAIVAIKARALEEPLVINGGVQFNTDITIDVSLVFAPGAYFTITSGHTVTIANSIDSPRQHIFRGDGAYVLSNVGTTGENARQVHAAWFGVFPYAGTNPVDQGPLIQAIATAMGNARESVIDFDVGNYTVQSQVLLTRCCWIRGQGSRRTVFRTTTDGFALFASNAVGVKLTDCQFEITSPLSARTSPWVDFAHGECEAYNLNMGNSARGITISGANARIRNISAAYGYSPGSGSSLVEVTGGSGTTIEEVMAGTSSAYGPENLVLIGGPNQSGTISGVAARGVGSLTPARNVAVIAQGGGIARVTVSDIRHNSYAGTAPDSAVLYKTVGTYGLSDCTLDGVVVDSYPTACVRFEQTSSGIMEDISLDNVNISGATGNGIEFIRTAGTLQQIKVGPGVDVSERTTPYYYSGTTSEIIIDPMAVPSALAAVCYDLGDVADDTAVSIPLRRVVYTGTVEVTAGYVYWGDFVVRAASSPNFTKKSGHANVAGLAAVLSGTTGTDGNMTLGVQSSTLYVENRLGSTQRIQLILKTGIR